jgi:hypothetical protein
MDWWQWIKDWFFELGDRYNVNPWIFGSIYVGAIPFFFASLYWTVNRIRRKKSPVIQVLLTGLFFISAYLYLIIVGRHISVWVYIFIAVMIAYGLYSTIQRIKALLKK